MPASRDGSSSRSGGRVRSAQQGLPEPPSAHEVEVLLARRHVHAGDRRAHRRRDVGVGHHRELGLAEEAQPVRLRGGRELVEVERLVDLGEVVVEQRAVGPGGEVAELLPQREVARLLPIRGIGDQRDQRARFGEPRARLGDPGDVEPEDFPGHPADVAARQRVVADERDAPRREVARDDGEQRRAHVLGYPRVHAVRDDVVERRRRRRKSRADRAAAARGWSAPAWPPAARPAAMGCAARSQPTNVECGSVAAIGMRLPPLPQPISSTRQRSTGAAVTPVSAAMVARRSGCVDVCA